MRTKIAHEVRFAIDIVELARRGYGQPSHSNGRYPMRTLTSVLLCCSALTLAACTTGTNKDYDPTAPWPHPIPPEDSQKASLDTSADAKVPVENLVLTADGKTDAEAKLVTASMMSSPWNICPDGTKVRKPTVCPAPAPTKASLQVQPAAGPEGTTIPVTVSRSGGDLSQPATFQFLTEDSTAKAGVDYYALSVSGTIASGASAATFQIRTIDNTTDQPDRALRVRVTSTTDPVAVGSADVGVLDNDVTPEPPPPPAPEPLPDPGTPTDTGLNGNVWVPVETADGAVPINTSEGDLSTASIPGTAAPDVVGAFRFVCRQGEIARDDSLLYWGQPGKAHWHFFYGLTKPSASDTYATMQTKQTYSTCQAPSNDPGNRSNYWTAGTIITLPTGATAPVTTKLDTSDTGAVDANGKLTKPKQFFWLIDHFQLYYKRRPVTDPLCKYTSVWGPAVEGCVAIPNGINMIFGFDMKNMRDGVRPAEFQCVGATGVDSSKFNVLAPALARCAAAWEAGLRSNLRVVTRIEAPSCWDPRFRDSPNHQDHLSYNEYKSGTGKNGCMLPGSGAMKLKSIPALTYLESRTFTQEVYDAYKSDSVWGVRLSCDDMVKQALPDGAAAGKCAHADFRMSWLVKVRDKWEQNCLDKLLNCSSGVLGNGQMLRGGGAPYYPSLGKTSWTHPTPIVPVRAEGYGADW